MQMCCACGGGKTTGGAPSPPPDKYSYCPYWKNYGYCETNSWVRANCQTSCANTATKYDTKLKGMDAPFPLPDTVRSKEAGVKEERHAERIQKRKRKEMRLQALKQQQQRQQQQRQPPQPQQQQPQLQQPPLPRQPLQAPHSQAKPQLPPQQSKHSSQ